MPNQKLEQFEILNQENDHKHVAHVVLNGYNIEQEDANSLFGAMRSFKIIEGDLTEAWSTRRPLLIRSQHGQDTKVRIAALPVDEDSYGLIEFV